MSLGKMLAVVVALLRHGRQQGKGKKRLPAKSDVDGGDNSNAQPAKPAEYNTMQCNAMPCNTSPYQRHIDWISLLHYNNGHCKSSTFSPRQAIFILPSRDPPVRLLQVARQSKPYGGYCQPAYVPIHHLPQCSLQFLEGC